ncbi:MAG: SdpA family antimicrobial peptide system protein [Staphylococcus equorum]|nr:SdpA family antimicrobial peptide system protein [Staphylococcus equorum]
MSRKIIFFITLMLGLTFLFYSIVNTLAITPLSMPSEQRTQLQKLMPQEWGFFSKDPREDFFTFVEDNGEKIQLPNASLSNFWGISRVGRAQGTEAGLIYSSLPEDEIYQCEDYIDDCIKQYSNHDYTLMKSPIPSPKLCGEYSFFMLETVPFAWVNSVDERYIAKNYAKVEVTC